MNHVPAPTEAAAGAPIAPPLGAGPTPSVARRSGGHATDALVDVLRSEWIKLSTVRGTIVLLGVTAAFGLAVAWAVALLVTDEVLLVAQVFTYSSVLTALLASIGGIVVFTAEVHHGTLAAAIGAHPSRRVIVVGKTLAAAALGAVLGAIGLVAGLVGAVVGGLAVGDASTIVFNAVWALVFTCLASVLGLGVGLVVRQSAAAIAGLLAWWLVLENLLLVVLPGEAARLLPYIAGGGLLDIDNDWEFYTLTRPQNAVVFGVYAGAAVIVGACLLRRRDAA